jgi:crotonobetainyl-CoA:carnitine CoA-transferase CaiB-like acyl-CoA transferase
MTDHEGALAGVRVVEYGGLVSAAYAAKLMADLGADVVKVEPPEGDPSRRRGPFPTGHEGDPDASGLFIFLNTNKRGVTLDITVSADREMLLELLADADVFIHNVPRRRAAEIGIDAESLSAHCPRLVHTWITPFGLSGPYADYEADELNVVAAGGWLSMSPGNAPGVEYPPLKAFGRQADFQAGATAAVATMGALFAREQTGAGQLVDVSGQEVIGTEVEVALARQVYAGEPTRHFGAVSIAGMGVTRCKDGYIYVMAAQPHQWTALVHMLGDPEWAKAPELADRAGRALHDEEIRGWIEEWTGERTVEEVFELAGKARLPFAQVSTMGRLINSPHLAARGFFAAYEQPGTGQVTVPGAPYKLGRTPWRLRTPAPRLGEHDDEIFGARLQEGRA